MTSVALQPLLLMRLQEVICLRGEVLKKEWLETQSLTRNSSRAVFEQLLAIPLQLAKNVTPLHYRSAIAFKLAQSWQIPVLDVANQLANCCTEAIATSQSDNHSNLADQIWQQFTVQVLPPGWLHFQLSEVGLAIWLQSWIDTSMPDQPLVTNGTRHLLPSLAIKRPSSSFPSQYAHARCCSLLQLADREGIIQLSRIGATNQPSRWTILKPQPIPWLTEQSGFSTASSPSQPVNPPIFQLSHPAEYQLITQIAAALDELAIAAATHSPISIGKIINALNQAFAGFYATCRIWGKPKMNDLPLAQARLGLLLVTQSLLQWLLQDWLGTDAPEEL